MTSDALDPRRQKMVAALYGELSPREEREFMAILDTDDELRAEWEELQGARSFLQQVEAGDSAPAFDLLMPADAPQSFDVATAISTSRPTFWERLGNMLRTPATGFAVATAALLVLIVAGLRVDRTPGGLMVRFAPASRTEVGGGPGLNAPQPGDRAVGLSPATVQPASAGMPDPNSPVTYADMALFTQHIMEFVEARVVKGEERMYAETSFAINGLYDTLDRRHERDRAQFATEFGKLWTGLIGATNQQLQVREGGVPLVPRPPESQQQITPINQSSEQ